MELVYILLTILTILIIKYFFLKDIMTSLNNTERIKQTYPKKSLSNIKQTIGYENTASKEFNYKDLNIMNFSNNNTFFKSHSEEVESILSQSSPEHLIEYKKIIYNSEHLSNVITVFNGNEVGKDNQRKELKNDLIKLLYFLLVVFNLTAISLFIFLAYKDKIDNLMDLFKWFLVVTLGEIIAMIFFIVKFLFSDNVKMYEQIKNIILNK